MASRSMLPTTTSTHNETPGSVVFLAVLSATFLWTIVYFLSWMAWPHKRGVWHCLVVVSIHGVLITYLTYMHQMRIDPWPYRGPAPFHRLTPNKRFEPVFSTVIMAVCSLFNRMLLLTDLIPVHLLYCGQTVMIGCNHTSFEWTRAVRHIYGIIRHMQGLYSHPGT